MHSWQPSKYLKDPQEYRQKYVSETSGQGKFALIVLNQPILIQRHLFENVWNNGNKKTGGRIMRERREEREREREREEEPFRTLILLATIGQLKVALFKYSILNLCFLSTV